MTAQNAIDKIKSVIAQIEDAGRETAQNALTEINAIILQIDGVELTDEEKSSDDSQAVTE